MEDYYYDRTRNISGVSYVDITGFCPSYGLTASFTAENKSLKTSNNYEKLHPNAINSLVLTFSVFYESDELGAKKIVNTLESFSGENALVFSTDNFIYKNLSGYCNGYSVSHISDESYRVNTSITVNEAPNLLNWKNTNFLNFDYKEWSNTGQYEQDDVVYYNLSEQKIDNFYYCTGDHSASESNSPTGVNSAWTQSFYWAPDVGASTDVNFDLYQFNGAWKRKHKTDKNIAKTPMRYSFSSISRKQLVSMLHFLENKGGYRRFEHQIPTVFNKPKIFRCESWDHTWKTKDSHDLVLTLNEDVLGVMPKEVPVGGEIPKKIKSVSDTAFGGYGDGGFDEGSLPV